MNKMIKYTVALVLLLTTACESNDSVGQDKPYISKDYLQVAHQLQLSAEGTAAELRVEANCAWHVDISEDWLAVSPAEGSMSQTISILAAQNTTGVERTAILKLTAGSAPQMMVTVTQPSQNKEIVEEKRLAVSPVSLEFEASGGVQSLTLTSNTSWVVSSSPEWCILSAYSGSGNAEIGVTAEANPTEAQRRGHIIVAGEGVNPITISLVQKESTSSQKEPDPGDNLPPS